MNVELSADLGTQKHSLPLLMCGRRWPMTFVWILRVSPPLAHFIYLVSYFDYVF